ncbi:MmgE/PrpD family protein [Compostimonas suwonensis]|uniref:2-methylcitrate dehydratase PrpD n=1 Tax=Compostimonas suwonensis TaxID=1048394 RepID=A0A2M9BCC4_9MICO|nr:MmgE/PrpD family protein [Compostimonas suwonensis]PJJ55605.1 2-methylcitrate dehydratase PrpD [Compostimonas suwonensis]
MSKTTASPANSTGILAEFASQLRFADLPPEVVAHAKRCIADTVACGLYGSTLPWTRILHESIASVDGEGGCVVWGTPGGLSAPDAALVNGAAVHGFELDDLHQQSIVHPGSVVLPAALALAELDTAVTGEQLVTAVVVGYEVAARVGMSVGAAHLLQGFHPTATHGTLGAAAAAGSILGLDADAMHNALGIAGTQSSGLMAAQFESMVKRFHAGRAAQSGVYSAVLAAHGYTGIDDLFESGYGGYLTTLSPRHDASLLTAGLGEVWETLRVGFKPYSTNGSCHPAIDALLELRETEGLRLEDVDRVTLHVSSATKEHVGWLYEPDSVTTAQMNLPYIVAVVLADGDAFVNQFTPERIADPGLVAFSRRVHVEADAAIDARGDTARHTTRLELRLKDGRVLHAAREFARGSGRLPLTTIESAQKFDKLTEGVATARRPWEVYALVEKLDGAQSASSLAEALRSETPMN